MARRMTVCAMALVVTSLAFAADYTVTTTADTGVGSLRWAIGQANANAGPDTIRLKPELSGQWIVPRTPLPAITATTSILGDTNADGIPDLVVSGAQAGAADGLRVEADNCVIEGVAVFSFARHGIVLWYADGCIVRYCSVGVNAAGTKALPNGQHQVYVRRSHGNTIGRVEHGGRNIIAAGAANGMWSGIYLGGSRGNAIKNNYIGVARDGVTPLADAATSGVGVTLISLAGFVPSGAPTDSPRVLYEARENLIGGLQGDRNVIGGMQVGIDMVQAFENLVSANYLGVGGDGATAVPIQDHAVRIRDGSQRNNVSPQRGDPARMNVISSRSVGVGLQGAGTQDNGISGNRFGRNVAGTRTLPLGTGVRISNGAGPQTISENLFRGRNPSTTGYAQGVYLLGSGQGSRIEGNQFCESLSYGVNIRSVGAEVVGNTFRGDGGGATGIECWDTPSSLKIRQNTLSGLYEGVTIRRGGGEVVGNVLKGTTTGVRCVDAPFSLKVWENLFKVCPTCVRLSGDSMVDLGSVAQSQAGMNVFCTAATPYYIFNGTDNDILAEGNRFLKYFYPKGPYARIWDQGDDPELGKVDVHPLGPPLYTCANALTLSGTAAAPTALGAEVAFTLSADAAVTVSVLNLAGRPIATVCRARECSAGTNRLSWNACTDTGLTVPSGRYLIQVRAQGPDGAEARALTTVLIGP